MLLTSPAAHTQELKWVKFGVVPSIYRNTVGNLTVQLWFRYQPPYQISGSIKKTTLEITKLHPTYNDNSCPLIETGVITPWCECYIKSQYIGS